MVSGLNLNQQIEALLFHKNEPVKLTWLAKTLNTNNEVINMEIAHLRDSLAERGIVLIELNDAVALGTHPGASELIEVITRTELGTELGKAGLETLSVILYKGPISRSAIDYIRGVNSQFTLRHLMVRGLIERMTDPHHGRSTLYQPTIALLKHMGIRTIGDLPEYTDIKERLSKIESLGYDGEEKQTK